MNGTALVTGAASGIDEPTAIKLCASGWTVTAVDIDPDGLAALALRVSGLRTHVCDVSDEGAIDNLWTAVGPVDRLVHAAAICPGRVDTPQYRAVAAEDPAAVADRRDNPTTRRRLDAIGVGRS